MRFKNKFTVTKNGVQGKVIWWGHDTVGIEYTYKGKWKACYEVLKSTLRENLKLGIYEVRG